jgi:hypothetical protein
MIALEVVEDEGSVELSRLEEERILDMRGELSNEVSRKLEDSTALAGHKWSAYREQGQGAARGSLTISWVLLVISRVQIRAIGLNMFPRSSLVPIASVWRAGSFLDRVPSH